MGKSEELHKRSYDDKRYSLEEALGLIKTGDHIFIGSACGEPQYLVRGLVEKANRSYAWRRSLREAKILRQVSSKRVFCWNQYTSSSR